VNAYSSLAAVYDRLNADIDYSAWADYIERQFEKYAGKKTVSVLDLACGTGTMTVEFARRGYDMTGVDLSEDMLCEAKRKCDAAHFTHPVLLVRQNMTELELYGTVNAALCCLDSLNYITDTGDLRRVFAHIHNYLEPDGLFVFDINTPTKFEHTYADNAYILEDDGLLCAWQNCYRKNAKICDFYLSIFCQNSNGSWQRFDEQQRERCYSLRTVKKILAETGFSICELSSDWNGSPIDDSTERWYFTVRRIDIAAKE